MSVQKAQQIPEIPVIRHVAAVLAQIDAGKHEFGVPGAQQTAGFIQNLLRGAAARPAACERHDAVGAAVRATVLHFEDGPGAPETADPEGREICRRFSPDALRRRKAGRVPLRPGAAQQAALVLLRHQQVRFGPGRAGPRAELREQAGRAAGKDQACRRGFAPQAEDRIARVAFAFGGDGATVDAEHIGLARHVALLAAQLLPGFAQGLAFVLIDLAAEGRNEKFPGRHGR